MNSVKSKALSVKNHIHRNRGKYGIAIGFTAAAVINQQAARQWNTFLEENDLVDKFYAIPE